MKATKIIAKGSFKYSKNASCSMKRNRAWDYTNLQTNSKKKAQFTEGVRENRWYSLTRLLAIMCSDSPNGKKWQGAKKRDGM